MLIEPNEILIPYNGNKHQETFTHMKHICLAILIRRYLIPKLIKSRNKTRPIQHDFSFIFRVILESPRRCRDNNFSPCLHVIYGLICYIKSIC